MNDALLNFLMYALPSGFLVQLLNWWLSRRKRKVQDMGDIDGLYIENINKLREELIKTQDENRKVYRDIGRLERAVSKLERAISKATTCRHFDDCPIRNELPEQTGDGTDYRPVRQHGKRENNRHPPRNGTATPQGEA